MCGMFLSMQILSVLSVLAKGEWLFALSLSVDITPQLKTNITSSFLSAKAGHKYSRPLSRGGGIQEVDISHKLSSCLLNGSVIRDIHNLIVLDLMRKVLIKCDKKLYVSVLKLNKGTRYLSPFWVELLPGITWFVLKRSRKTSNIGQ